MSRRRKFSSVLLASLLTGVVAVEVAPSPVQAANVDGAWTAVGDGMPDGTVFQIVSDAAGNVYAAGTFTSAAGVANTRNIAKWNGTAWTAVGTGVTTAGPNGALGGLYAVALDPGANAGLTSDDVIYVGGEVAGVGGVAVNRVAKWDGAAWQSLGGVGATSNGVNNTSEQWDGVEEIVVVSSSDVYIGGAFDNAYVNIGGVVANSAGIAKWNGTTLSAVGTGISGAAGTVIVNGMTKAANGNVIATGQFTSAGGAPVLRIAQWNGTTWSNFGSTTSGAADGVVAAAAAAANGDVFIGGTFTKVKNSGTDVANTNRIAMWDASASNNAGAWISIGSVAGVNPVIEELRVIGNYLYAGGAFSSIGGVNANNIARMDLATNVWEPLVSGCFNGVTGAVRSIIDAGSGSIYVAGGFTDAGGVSAADRIAKFTPGAATGCAAGFRTLDAPTNFIHSYGGPSAKVGGKNGFWLDTQWDPPKGANAPIFYKVSVEQVEWIPATRTQAASYKSVTPRPELDCWSFTNRCRIFMAYSTQGGFGITEARFTLVGYSFDGATAPLYIEAVDPYAPVFPSAVPTDVVATPGWGTVTVTYKAPSYTGSYPITNYLVQATPGGSVCITRMSDPSLLSCTFTKLTPGTNYTFRVQALNGAGWSDKSAPSAVASPQTVKITKFNRTRARFLLINRGSDVTVEGIAPGFPAGSSVTAWVKYGNGGQWTPLGDVKINANGTFSWKRRFPTRDDRTALTITFTQGTYQGNEVSMGPVR